MKNYNVKICRYQSSVDILHGSSRLLSLINSWISIFCLYTFLFSIARMTKFRKSEVTFQS